MFVKTAAFYFLTLDELDETEVKASLIWIIGDDADELLGIFDDKLTKESVRLSSQPSPSSCN